MRPDQPIPPSDPTPVTVTKPLAGILPVVEWVLAVLQASLAVQIVIHALRVLEVLPGRSS